MTHKELKALLDLFTIGYNKGQVLNTVSSKAMDIITHNMHNISDSLEDVLTAFEEIRSSSENSSSHSHNIDSAMDQLLKRNKDISTRINNSSSVLNQTTQTGKEIQGRLTELNKRSSHIQDMSHEIQSVADTTNILAINASIEAARAGESGKGFRIIAGEVRNLASQTHDFADQITESIAVFFNILGDVTKEMDNFMKNMDAFVYDLKEVEDTFQENSVAADQSVQIVSEILQSIQEQSSALNFGLKSLVEVTELVKESESVSEGLQRSHLALDQLLTNGKI
jgi:methyl-accepting chemotaxis protein